jgi:hypothetical protein
MKHQRNFFVSILKFILITAAIFILLLFVSCVLFSFYYKDIFMQFFQRDVSIGKVDFNIPTKTLTINDIHWAVPEGEKLLSAKEIQIKPDFKKLLKLQIAFEEVTIDGVKTYVVQKGNSYKLPPFLPERKSSLNFKIPKIPIVFSAITVSNSTVHLRRNGKDYRFLSELTVKLPSVSDKMSEIKPVISGNLNRKPFNFVGKTKFNENGDIINQFNVSSRNLNIAENRIFLPVFPGIKMQQGIVNLDISIEYIIRKKRKSSLVFSGAVAVQNLVLNTNVGQIADRLTGRAVVRRYDFTQKQLDVESLSVNYANIKLPKDFFVTKNNNEAAKFQIKIDNALIKNTSLALPEVTLANINGSVSNFSQSLKNTAFDLSATLGKGQLYANGKSNGMSEFAFDKLSVKNISLPQALPVTKKIKQLKSINIQQLSGSGRLQLFPNKKPGIDFSGNGIFSDAECEFVGKKVGAKNISVSVKDLNTSEQSVVLQKLQFSGLYFNTDKTYLSDCSFVMEPGEHFLKLTQDFSLDDNWKIKTLSGVYGKNKQIFANISNVDLQLKMQLSKEQLNAQAACQIDDSVIYHNGALSARLRNVDIGSAKLSNNKSLRLNIDQGVSAKFLYLKTILSDAGSLEIAGIPLFSFGNNTQKSDKKDFQLHLSRLSVDDGEIDFLDNRKSSVAFAYKFTDISWKSSNFPSFIYPQGSLDLSGKVDKANPFSLHLTCDATQIKGKFSCSNALLSPFSEYSQKYLGHSVKNGRLTMNIPFSVTAKEISSDVELQLIKPEFKRMPTSTFALNLDKTLRAMMNRSGVIDLKFPVSVLLEEKKIKYTDLFFEVLSKTLQSSSDRIAIPIQEEIIFDNVFSIAYFKGGSTKISTDTFLSEKMLEKLANHKNVFAINGFVDKQNDTEYLKRELVAKALKKYITGEGETARKQALREMLLQEYGEESSDSEDSDVLLQRVLDHLVVSQDDFRALAFERARAVASYLEENYNIAHNKIYVREDNNIFENPYVSGISNSIAVIRSGRLVE